MDRIQLNRTRKALYEAEKEDLQEFLVGLSMASQHAYTDPDRDALISRMKSAEHRLEQINYMLYGDTSGGHPAPEMAAGGGDEPESAQVQHSHQPGGYMGNSE